AGVDVEKHRATRIGSVRNVGASGRKIPDQPGIDRPERELAALRALARARHVIENPLELGAGEIGVDDKPGSGCNIRGVSGGPELVAVARRAAILPDNRVPDRPARGALPDERGLALIGNADRGDVRRTDASFCERFVHYTRLRCPDFGCIVLDPSWLGEDLTELSLRSRGNGARTIEQQRTRARRALIEGQDVGHSGTS